MRTSLLVLCALLCAVNADLYFKHRAGEPSEFGNFVLPTPSMNAEIENSASYYIDYIPAGGMSVRYDVPIYCDSQGFSFTIFSTLLDKLQVSLLDPNGKPVNVAPLATTSYFPIGYDSVRGTSYTLPQPLVGKYQLSLVSLPLTKPQYEYYLNEINHDGYIIVANEGNIAAFTNLNSYSLFPGQQVGVVTRVTNEAISFDDVKAGKVPSAIQATGTTATMSVRLPDGTYVYTPMHDDGLHNDGSAQDGVFAASITAPTEGDYIIHATVSGVTSDGVQFERTTEQLVPVIDQIAQLQGTAMGVMESSGNRMIVNIVATPKSELAQYRAYAEVWGKDANGNDLAVCWIGGMTFAQQSGSDVYIPLELDMNWVSRVAAQEPFTLRNVIIQDPDTYIPYDQMDMVPLKVAGNFEAIMASLPNILLTPAKPYPISEEMMIGRRPDAFKIGNVTAPQAEAPVILVHGYCVVINPWEAVKAQFTNYKLFLSAKSNDGQDAFAKKLVAFAGNGGWSYISHSQGGLVGAHILEFYFSGLDLVSGGRLVQSVGSPYQGTSAAGSAADLGNLFGAGCGSSKDMTRDGAGLWLKTISTDSRGKVFFYTTTANTCNFMTNLVLSKPNDGISEYNYALLPGGQNGGNKENWCHSVDMKFPAQTQDATRNAEMNRLAARAPVTESL